MRIRTKIHSVDSHDVSQYKIKVRSKMCEYVSYYRSVCYYTPSSSSDLRKSISSIRYTPVRYLFHLKFIRVEIYLFVEPPSHPVPIPFPRPQTPSPSSMLYTSATEHRCFFVAKYKGNAKNKFIKACKMCGKSR